MSPMDLSNFSFAKLFPPSLRINPQTDYTDHYNKLCARLRTIGRNAGTSSNGFKLRKQEIMAAQPDINKIIKVMHASKYIRPLLAVWNDTPVHTMNYPVPFAGELIAHIGKLALQSRRGRLGRLALFELCNLFFRFYDDLECMEEISSCLKTHLRKYQHDEKIMGLDKVREHIDDLISSNGHNFLANTADATGQKLADVANYFNIPQRDSRFYDKALAKHYLIRIKQLSPNEDSEILREIVNSRDYEIKLNRRFRIGHQIVTWLMDKLMDSGLQPSELWRDVILRIAGDPRMPPHFKSFSKWWTPIDLLRPERKYPQTMRGWLSKADLELFLKIMAQYANNQGYPALKRMYPERERFLRGLFKKGLIKETRLFLGSKLMRNVQNPLITDSTLEYAQIRDGGETAIFYLNLGRAHLIEASYNCAMRIMDRIPGKSCLNGFPKIVSNTELRRRLEDEYDAEFGSASGFYEVYHRHGWQGIAVTNLNRMGIQILPSDVMDRDTFYGVSG